MDNSSGSGWGGGGGGGGGRGVLPYMAFLGMCRCEGYGFQSFNQFTLGKGIQIRAFGSRVGYHFSGN